MAINYRNTYGSTGSPTSGWTAGSIAPSLTQSYDQIKSSLPPGATEQDVIREATRLGVIPPAPVLTGSATPEQLRATEERFRQIKSFLPNSQMRFRSFTGAGVSPASSSSANPRSGGGNARSGMGVAEGRQGTAIAPGRGSAAPVSSGWTAGTVAPQLSLPVQTAGVPIGQAMLTPPRYPGDVPAWLPDRVAQLNAGQNFRTDLMGLLFGQGGMPQGGGRGAIDPLIAQGYNQAAQAAAGLQRAQTQTLQQPQRIADQLSYWQNQLAAYNTTPAFAGAPVNPQVGIINARILALQNQLRGVQPMATRAAGASSGWTPAVIPQY